MHSELMRMATPPWRITQASKKFHKVIARENSTKTRRNLKKRAASCDRPTTSAQQGSLSRYRPLTEVDYDADKNGRKESQRNQVEQDAAEKPCLRGVVRSGSLSQEQPAHLDKVVQSTERKLCDIS